MNTAHRKIKSMFGALFFGSMLLLPLAACEDDGPFEEIGEEVDDAVDDVKDEVEDATDG